jgi:transposase
MKKIVMGIMLVSSLAMAEGSSDTIKKEVAPVKVEERAEPVIKLSEEQRKFVEQCRKDIQNLDEEITELLLEEEINWKKVEKLVKEKYLKASDLNIFSLKYKNKGFEG